MMPGTVALATQAAKRVANSVSARKSERVKRHANGEKAQD